MFIRLCAQFLALIFRLKCISEGNKLNVLQVVCNLA